MTISRRRRVPASTPESVAAERALLAPLRRRRFTVHGHTPDAARAARRALVEVIAGWGLSEADRWSVESVAGEMLANAFVHAPGTVGVGMHLSPDGARVVLKVHDESPTAPVARARYGSSVSESGRGMMIVAAFAERWGWQQSTHGKYVWAQIAVSSPVPVSKPSRALRRAAVIVEAVRAGRMRAVR